MIDYRPGTWGVSSMFRIRGSVVHKGLVWGVPVGMLAVLLHTFAPKLVDLTGIEFFWGSYTTVLGFLMVFKNNQAYARFWDGAALVQQMRGEWLNAVSSLIAFCNHDKAKQKEVAAFQHLLVRLMSMLHCAALQQIAQVKEDTFEIIVPHGIEESRLRLLANHHQERAEILLQWIQRLIVEQEAKGNIKIAPPILSRVYQELSRGIVNLHNVRRIKEIPVPFPYAQLIMLMMITHSFSTAFLTSQVASNPSLAGLLSVCVVTAFWCMFYIALELEQPFGEDNNDLPMAQMQRELNASLTLLLKPEVQIPPQFNYQEDLHAQLSTHFSVNRKSSTKSLVRRSSFADLATVGKESGPPPAKDAPIPSQQAEVVIEVPQKKEFSVADTSLEPVYVQQPLPPAPSDFSVASERSSVLNERVSPNDIQLPPAVKALEPNEAHTLLSATPREPHIGTPFSLTPTPFFEHPVRRNTSSLEIGHTESWKVALSCGTRSEFYLQHKESQGRILAPSEPEMTGGDVAAGTDAPLFSI